MTGRPEASRGATGRRTRKRPRGWQFSESARQPGTRGPHRTKVAEDSAYEPMDHPLRLLDGELTILRLPPDSPTPSWLNLSPRPLVSVTRTPYELSIVCPSVDVPTEYHARPDGGLSRSKGVVVFRHRRSRRHPEPACRSRISILSLSTFDTDYVLVRTGVLERQRLPFAGISRWWNPKIPQFCRDCSAAVSLSREGGRGGEGERGKFLWQTFPASSVSI